ncbi:ribonuclease hi [Plakobranchus ocellatus]|uniref:Ribonuclease hi n=1 Tax=Plakobranchus ocellatus TaxID=259542 RepID=A0AAV4DIZ8_9GAST|nr:ribonuclease hi [Plakobranchus ocellatus]
MSVKSLNNIDLRKVILRVTGYSFTVLAINHVGSACSSPQHPGNEIVDKLAKAALNRASCSGKLLGWSDLKPKVNAYIHTVWQENWDAEGANKLREVLPNLGEDLGKRGEGVGGKRETVMCSFGWATHGSPRVTF